MRSGAKVCESFSISVLFSQRRISVNLVDLHVPFSQFLFERDSYSNEYLVFTWKIRLRYSRERASQSLPKINQTLEEKLEKT